MGSGASKKANDTQSQSDDEEENFDTYTQKKAEANGQPKLEQAGLLPKLEQPPSSTNFKKPSNAPRTIIDLIDSDSEEDEFKPEYQDKNIHKSKAITNTQTKKADEKQLKNEILELEKTFESLELDRKSPTPRTGLFRTTSIAATAFMPPSFGGGGGGSGRPLAFDRGQNKTLQSLTTSNSFGNGGPKPLKFSWEESSTPKAVDKDSDEWTYKQTVIDGFDPAKFREANNKESKKHVDNGIRVERQFGSASSNESRGARVTTIEMPGVPSYDRTEKQLLASLEQELGVL